MVAALSDASEGGSHEELQGKVLEGRYKCVPLSFFVEDLALCVWGAFESLSLPRGGEKRLRFLHSARVPFYQIDLSRSLSIKHVDCDAHFFIQPVFYGILYCGGGRPELS